MLSIACDESTTEEAEPLPGALPMRRLAVTFEASARRQSGDKSEREIRRPSVRVPAYSRIVFRAGSVSVR